ncbi:hypothetical protein K3495_g7038 [Podosphaera aphanis]|nr:hypothetical protein K3495_g7038 [Podosphaera aphanis]
MPIHIIAYVPWGKILGLRNVWTLMFTIAAVAVIGLVKWLSKGTPNTSERQMHGKIVMITGGTSGIGAATAFDLAQRGAQIILLVHHSPKDVFLLDFIEDLRQKSGNELIYAEQVDLTSLHSIRLFATKWIDNAPPRRLDVIILCAATLTPPGKQRTLTGEGLEETWMVNYLANFHLLSILSPAIRAQPPDRDVRVIFMTCACYMNSPPINSDLELPRNEWRPSRAYSHSKLAINVFADAFQKHLNAYKRPDGFPMNAHVIVVNPGYTLTPGMRRWLTRGTLWGLGIYLLLWQFAWMLLKSPEDGAQSLLHAVMDPGLGRGSRVKLIKECQELEFTRSDVRDEAVAKKLWESSQKLIEEIEKKEAIKRTLQKKKSESIPSKSNVSKATTRKNAQAKN